MILLWITQQKIKIRSYIFSLVIHTPTHASPQTDLLNVQFCHMCKFLFHFHILFFFFLLSLFSKHFLQLVFTFTLFVSFSSFFVSIFSYSLKEFTFFLFLFCLNICVGQREFPLSYVLNDAIVDVSDYEDDDVESDKD